MRRVKLLAVFYFFLPNPDELHSQVEWVGFYQRLLLCDEAVFGPEIRLKSIQIILRKPAIMI